MIKHEYVVQYEFGGKSDGEEEFWDDESGAGRYVFDPNDQEGKALALAAAKAYATYCDHLEKCDDHPLFHRVVYRLTSDEVI